MAAWRQLEQQYQDMWLRWEAQEADSARQDSQAEADDEERQAFINSLLSQVSFKTLNPTCPLSQPAWPWLECRRGGWLHSVLSHGQPSVLFKLYAWLSMSIVWAYTDQDVKYFPDVVRRDRGQILCHGPLCRACFPGRRLLPMAHSAARRLVQQRRCPLLSLLHRYTPPHARAPTRCGQLCLQHDLISWSEVTRPLALQSATRRADSGAQVDCSRSSCTIDSGILFVNWVAVVLRWRRAGGCWRS